MELGITGLRVLVTAGAGGIGLEIARAFRAESARVHVCDVDRDALSRLADSDPGISQSHADVADRGSVAQLFADATAALGGLDVLVNNAGISGPTAPVQEVDPDDWDRTLAVNITGQFNCVRLAVPHLLESANPSIINLSSAAGRFGFPLRSPYSASKWAVVGFTKTLAIELGPQGIRVNAILPGVVEGERVRRIIASKAEARGIGADEMRAEFLGNISMRTAVTPQQIADQIVFLCSPRGRTISGQAIAIDGDAQSLA
ncbi:NAD(P)-dependent dehydrogenase, short-chain alcohol dehydrogenase family [Paracoccus solventivorans]|uniref:NAD(P)-dependent dehydrogenase, short-chain alcohol dehydrogenase family n=1 Tax=Paracoccus solventivorans TaxID=53463 RepID=A0A1M7JDC4_9RHOB|nr:SDR family oxidoreductase [Paracoccus solventivorans]SHM51019.1 NAD(P)-dependent dehydrogenase, short-chain alcohol dehydrogenase family [Paracoccus solventivorans]